MVDIEYLKNMSFTSNIFTNLNMRATQLISSYSYLYGVVNELYLDTKDTENYSENIKLCLDNFENILKMLNICQQTLMDHMINNNQDENDIGNIISFFEYCESDVYDIFYNDNKEFLDFIDELFYEHKRINSEEKKEA